MYDRFRGRNILRPIGTRHALPTKMAMAWRMGERRSPSGRNYPGRRESSIIRRGPVQRICGGRKLRPGSVSFADGIRWRAAKILKYRGM